MKIRYAILTAVFSMILFSTAGMMANGSPGDTATCDVTARVVISQYQNDSLIIVEISMIEVDIVDDFENQSYRIPREDDHIIANFLGGEECLPGDLITGTLNVTRSEDGYEYSLGDVNLTSYDEIGEPLFPLLSTRFLILVIMIVVIVAIMKIIQYIVNKSNNDRFERFIEKNRKYRGTTPRLKEAEKAYHDSKRDYLKGRISKEELKENLLPYKNDLAELGLVKIRDEEMPK